jgi:hypothetical protein
MKSGVTSPDNLGIPHLAVVHYERVLTMVRQRMDGEEHDEMKDVSPDRFTWNLLVDLTF